MRGAILHAARDIRVEQREDPKIEQPTDAIIRLAATCVHWAAPSGFVEASLVEVEALMTGASARVQR